MTQSHQSQKGGFSKRTVLVLILSNIVISDMEANTKIVTDVQMVKICIMIKKDEYNDIMFV